MKINKSHLEAIRLNTVLSVSSLLIGSAVIGGCVDNKLPPIGANEHFQADDEARRVDDIFAQQIANGAREDGTFYAMHFTDGRLNSLGYHKLSAIASGPEQGKLAIYLDLPKGDAYSMAQDSMIKALARGGIAESDYTITAGANPDLSAPAAQGLAALAKQSKSSTETGAASDAATASAK